METTPTYDPKDPIFNEATLPDDFCLADMEHYADLPIGLTELTMDGAEIHGREVPLVRPSQGWRTFLMKEQDGAAALVRLTGERIPTSLLMDYLQTHARNVTGFHIREMGLLAATLYDLACDFAEANDWFLRDQQQRLPDTCARVSGAPLVHHELHHHVVTIEIENRVPGDAIMLRNATSAMPYWKRWQEALHLLPEWVAGGHLKRGVSVYREGDIGKPYRLQSLAQAPRSLHSSDIFIVTSPTGAVCMLCLDTLNAFSSSQSYTIMDMPTMQWLERNEPRLVKTMMKREATGWGHIEAMCLYVTESVMEAHQAGMKNAAWPAGEIPPLNVANQYTPFVLDYELHEPEFNALDVAQIIQEG